MKNIKKNPTFLFGVKYNLLVLIVFQIIVISCKKDILQNDLIPINSETIIKNYRPFNQTEIMLINYNQGSQDRLIKEVQLITQKVLVELLQDKSYIDLIISDAKNSPIKQAEIGRLCNLNSEFKNDLDRLTIKYANESGLTADNYESLEKLMIYEGVSYIGVIVIPNLENFDSSLPPIISGGLELDESLDSELDDDIYAIQFKADGKQFPIILNEIEALNALQPIIIFANGISDAEFNHGTVYGEGLHVVSTGNKFASTAKLNTYTQHFSLMHISIKDQDYFYEPLTSGTKNNYAFTGVYFTEENVWGWLTVENPSDLSRVNREFTKDECDGTKFLHWDEFWNVDGVWPQPTSTLTAFYNTFERDWAQSSKNLGSYTYSGVTANLVGKRKYTVDWYISDPYTEGGKVFTGSGATLWQYFNIYNYKSDYCLTRSE